MACYIKYVERLKIDTIILYQAKLSFRYKGEINHQLNGSEFEQAPGVGDGQGSLVCFSSWGHKALDTTEWLNWTEGFPIQTKAEVTIPDLQEMLKKLFKLRWKDATSDTKTSENMQYFSKNEKWKITIRKLYYMGVLTI